MLAGGVPDLNTFHGFGHGDFSEFFKEMDWMNLVFSDLDFPVFVFQ